jgi:hypothetical protein
MQNPEQLGQPAPLWKVGVPVQTMIQDKQKGFVPGWEIPIIMFDNSTFNVTVPADKFTPDSVKQAIEDHVSRLVMIRSLTGPIE